MTDSSRTNVHSTLSQFSVSSVILCPHRWWIKILWVHIECKRTRGRRRNSMSGREREKDGYWILQTTEIYGGLGSFCERLCCRGSPVETRIAQGSFGALIYGHPAAEYLNLRGNPRNNNIIINYPLSTGYDASETYVHPKSTLPRDSKSSPVQFQHESVAGPLPRSCHGWRHEGGTVPFEVTIPRPIIAPATQSRKR
jgi:hypothetical protein